MIPEEAFNCGLGERSLGPKSSSIVLFSWPGNPLSSISLWHKLWTASTLKRPQWCNRLQHESALSQQTHHCLQARKQQTQKDKPQHQSSAKLAVSLDTGLLNSHFVSQQRAFRKTMHEEICTTCGQNNFGSVNNNFVQWRKVEREIKVDWFNANPMPWSILFWALLLHKKARILLCEVSHTGNFLQQLFTPNLNAWNGHVSLCRKDIVSQNVNDRLFGFPFPFLFFDTIVDACHLSDLLSTLISLHLRLPPSLLFISRLNK